MREEVIEHTQNAEEESLTASFQLIIQADSSFSKSDDTYTLKVNIKTFRGRSPDQLIPIGESKTMEISGPTSTFKDEAQARAWAEHTFRSFRARSTAGLLDEATLVLEDEASYALNELGIEAVDLRDVLKTHIRSTNARLKQRLDSTRSGRQARWNISDLSREVTRALKNLPKRERTYERVAEKLKEVHGEKAPESGEALRKMLVRGGLDWQKMKSGQIKKLEMSAA